MSKPSLLRRMFAGVARVFAFLRVSLANLFVLLVLVLVLALMFAGPEPVEVPDGAALLMEPKGFVVEQEALADPLTFLTAGSTAQTPLRTLLDALENAAEDDRIAALVLDTSSIASVAPAQLEVIGDALDAFRESGKPIVAKGEFLSGHQYHLASFADEIYLDPLGEVSIAGYGILGTYFEGLLDKLDVHMHIFRVGTFKAAVEPYIRNDMSEEAKAANRELVDELWARYVARVAANRDLPPEAIVDYANRYDEWVLKAGGDAAQAALDYGLVDELLGPEAVKERLRQRFGSEADRYRHVAFSDYLQPTIPPLFGDVVGLITADGPIIMGKAGPGTIGAESVIALINQARKDDAVKALVVRVDSGGGSAFASEQIRRALVRVQDAGKPVVVSMAGTAASGGYWIAASADEIWAAPTTITGSIGVFSILPSMEETLSGVGITQDGVRTGPFVAGLDPFEPLGDEVSRVLQAQVEHIYDHFIDIVADGREMTRDAVGAVAEGRVWSGVRAHELGLVDQLGHLEDAIASAAQLAELENYKVRQVREPLSPQQQLIREALRNFGLAEAAVHGGQVQGIGSALVREVRSLAMLNDPRNVYAICESCTLRR